MVLKVLGVIPIALTRLAAILAARMTKPHNHKARLLGTEAAKAAALGQLVAEMQRVVPFMVVPAVALEAVLLHLLIEMVEMVESKILTPPMVVRVA